MRTRRTTMERTTMRSASSGWISDLFRASARAGFRRAYKQVGLDPEKYFGQVRQKFRIPVYSWEDLRVLSDEDLKPHADHIIKSSAKAAALEGAGLGLGGLVTVLPDFGILAAITIRMLQRLSLIYGFDYSTSDEIGSLWLAAASAAGLDLGREFVEKQAMERLVPEIIDQVAIRGRGGGCRKVGCAPDPDSQRRHRGCLELLVREILGTSRAAAFHRAPSRASNPARPPWSVPSFVRVSKRASVTCRESGFSI